MVMESDISIGHHGKNYIFIKKFGVWDFLFCVLLILHSWLNKGGIFLLNQILFLVELSKLNISVMGIFF